MSKKFPYCKLPIRKIKRPKFTNDSDEQQFLKVFLKVDILPASVFSGAVEVYDDPNGNYNNSNSRNSNNLKYIPLQVT